MDTHLKLLIDEIHVLCHRIEGYLDAQEAVKQSRLREFTTEQGESGCTIIRFPNARERAISDVGNEEPAVEQKSQETGIIEFTPKEICKMPQPIRKYFRIDGIKVRYRKKKNGVYELRCKINKQHYYGASTVLEQAKKRFIEDLHKNTKAERVEEPPVLQPTKDTPTVAEYAKHYLDTFKKPYVAEKNYANLVNMTRLHITPTLGEKRLDEITATDCQSILNALRGEGKKRTAETVNSLLKWICNGAMADGYLASNVMRMVKIPKHRRSAGKRIPSEQVQAFLEQEPKENYDYLIRFLLYTGLRPVEMKSAVFTGDFVTVKNAKTPTHEEATFRTLPIHSQLKPYIPKIMEILQYSTDCLNHKFKRRFPDFRLYDCRHTFTSVAQESGADKAWIDYVTNHVSAQNVTDRVYTHWSNSFSILQMEKIRF